MNISISNIAWDKKYDDEISKILINKKIKGIEIAPTKVSPEPIEAGVGEIKKYRNFWNDKGIEIVAIQSVLYGHPELTIFDNERVRSKTLSYLFSMIEVASNLGAKVIVFGSPKNRNIGLIRMDKAIEIARIFFYKIGEKAKDYGINFCIEPNPPQYETNFINNTKEAVSFVKSVNHPNFRLHLDLSTLTLNNENYSDSIKLGADFISHFHISEPFLQPVNEKNINKYKTAINSLKDINYKNWVSIEMLTDKDNEIEEVIYALSTIIKSYE